MRYSRFVAVCLGVAVLVNLVGAREKAQPKKDEITKVLKEAREHLVRRDAAVAADKQKEGDKEYDQFWALLVSVADKFPTVTPTRDDGKGKGKGGDDANKYTKLTLNTLRSSQPWRLVVWNDGSGMVGRLKWGGTGSRDIS